MNTKGIISACILDSTNQLLAQHDIPPIEIPTLTDKVSQEAIAAYTSNAGPDANAWVELNKMCNKARIADLLLGTLKDVVRTVRIDFPKSASAIDEIIEYAEAEIAK